MSPIEIPCSCAWNRDGSRTTTLCAKHAEVDPCLTRAQVTGKRRKGTIRRSRCTSCGWTEPNYTYPAARQALAHGRPYADYIEASVTEHVSKGHYTHEYAMVCSLSDLLVGNDGA